MLKKTLVAALVAVALTGTADAQPKATPTPVSDYTVFVDRPTGFAFVKLPQGWKFVGEVAAADLARLPVAVATDLLGSDIATAATGSASTPGPR